MAEPVVRCAGLRRPLATMGWLHGYGGANTLANAISNLFRFIHFIHMPCVSNVHLALGEQGLCAMATLALSGTALTFAAWVF